jgi:uncharacterized protein (TIGR02646 family)
VKAIQKGHPPQEFSEWYRKVDDTPLRYDDLRGDLRDIVVAALVYEQGGLCAYCMLPIGALRTPATIEHYVPQSDPQRGARLDLRWTNWLAVCYPVDHGSPPQKEANAGTGLHCDKARGDRPLLLRPSAQLETSSGCLGLSKRQLERYEDVEGLLAYRLDGTVYVDADIATRRGLSDEDIKNIANELNNTLNLNHWFLKKKRKQARDALISAMSDTLHPTEGWKPDAMERELRRQQSRRSDGTFREMCMVAVYTLKKRMKLRS